MLEENNPNSPQIEVLEIPEEQVQIRESVTGTAKTYVEAKKPGDKSSQDQILDRASSVALSGSKELSDRMSQKFTQEIDLYDSAEAQGAPTYKERLKQEQQKILNNQTEKFNRLSQFTDKMYASAEALVAEKAAQENLSPEATKELRDAAHNLVVDAVRSITYQDTAASSVTLGDHGWMHLTQDMRDTEAIASGKLNRALTGQESFVIGLAAAYHDIGYATPEVSDGQRASAKNYGSLDVGHPLLSFVHVRLQSESITKVLGEEATASLEQIIVNHENPERAALAGKYEVIARSFAEADAGAAFGPDKLPPVVSQVPEVLGYLNALKRQEDFDTEILPLLAEPEEIRKLREQIDKIEEPADGTQLEQLQNELKIARDEFVTKAKLDFNAQVVVPLRQQVADTITKKITDPDQAISMLNSLNHFGPNSMKYLLGRMAAESTAPQVENGKVVFPINAGFAQSLENNKVAQNAIFESAKLSVKLFREQAAVSLPPELEGSLIKVLENPSTVLKTEQTQQLADLGITVTMSGEGTDAVTAHLSTKNIVVQYRYLEPISAKQHEFYQGISTNLDKGNQATTEFINNYNKNYKQASSPELAGLL